MSKIMIVDDEPSISEILEFVFKDSFDVMCAQSGEESLKLVNFFMPDIILLDIMMPGINGYEVCKRIKADSKLKFIKIILISGMASTEERVKGYECGADDYIVKPFDVDEVFAKVNVFMKLKSIEEVDSIKGEFLSLISHETNTPLNGIIGLSELLLESKTITPDEKESIQMIYDSGYRLHDFLTKIRLLCELKTDARTIASVENYLCILNQISIMVNKKYSKNITFNIDVSPDIIFQADWGLVAKALTMLIDNAVRFSKDGGKVDIFTIINSNMCELFITDYGSGIPEEQIKSIFEEFAIADISHHNSGLGLSLATVQEIARIHCGTVRITSDPGVKTTVIFSLSTINGCER